MTEQNPIVLPEISGGLTPRQVQQLLRPIAPGRVLKDPRGNSHVSQQDVTAHLIRIFGFGNFDTDLLSVEMIYETERVNKETGELTGRWDVCYRATMRLTVKDENGNVIDHHEDGATHTAENQRNRGDAHDNAMKSAISGAKKRCAIHWGDQFGLSLYNKGQMSALVIDTLIKPEAANEGVDEAAPAPADADIQKNVPAQVALGDHDGAYEGEPGFTLEDLMARTEAATTIEEFRTIWLDAGSADLLKHPVDAQGTQLGAYIDGARKIMQGTADPSTTEAQATDGTAKEIQENQ